MTHSPLTNGVQITSDSSPRSTRIDRFIVHHAATTSLAAILALFQPGGRTVSANYALGSDGTLILAVDEDRRAWTSADANWDGRAVTIEVANSVAGGSWPVSDASFDKLARLIADVSLRYGFGINDDTVLTHQELYTRYGASYATSCPGDLQRRKGELLGKANYYRTFGGTAGGDVTPIIDKGDIEMRYFWAPSREGMVTTETGGPFYPANAEEAQALSKAYNGLDVTTREWDVLRQAALNRAGAVGKAESDLINKAINDAIDAALGDSNVEVSIDTAEIAKAVRAEFTTNPLK